MDISDRAGAGPSVRRGRSGRGLGLGLDLFGVWCWPDVRGDACAPYGCVGSFRRLACLRDVGGDDGSDDGAWSSGRKSTTLGRMFNDNHKMH